MAGRPLLSDVDGGMICTHKAKACCGEIMKRKTTVLPVRQVSAFLPEYRKATGKRLSNHASSLPVLQTQSTTRMTG